MNTIDFEPTFVLNIRAYRETSALVDCFCQHSGVVTIVAKGLKRRKSALAGLLTPFTPLLLHAKGRAELLSLYQVESHGAPYHLQERALFAGLYLNELCYRLLGKHVPHSDLFTDYQIMLRSLAEKGLEEIALRYFEMDLLSALGYGLPLSCEARTHQAIDANSWYHFIVDEGPVLYRGTEPAESQSMVFYGGVLLKLAAKALDSVEDCRQAKRLMRAILAFHLGDKPLHARSLMKKVHER